MLDGFCKSSHIRIYKLCDKSSKYVFYAVRKLCAYVTKLIYTHVTKLLFTEGEDFVAASPIRVLFPGGHTRANFDVLVVDNVKLEGSEKFIVSIDPLSLPYGVVLGDYPTAEVVIMDNEGNYIVHSDATIIVYDTLSNCNFVTKANDKHG